jgi:hypothetical protein
MERNGRPRTALARPGIDPFGRYQNSSGIVDRAKRSEACGRPIPAPKQRVICVFCSNWFLMPIGSEAVRGRSPDPSQAQLCQADPIQCAPSFTHLDSICLTAHFISRATKYCRRLFIQECKHWNHPNNRIVLKRIFLCSSIFKSHRQLSIIQGNGGRKVMDNPKPWLKQKQSKHGTKWISLVKKKT